MNKEQDYTNFIKWAEKLINKNTDRKGRKLQVSFFMDGEPFISTYPSLSYSLYLYNN